VREREGWMEREKERAESEGEGVSGS
jgi:hypothetical protein